MTLISDHPEQDYTLWQGTLASLLQHKVSRSWAGSWELGVVLCDVRLRPEQKYESVLNISHTSHLCQFDGINPLQEAPRLLEFHLRLFVSRKNSLFNV